jgi:hypothetical protein
MTINFGLEQKISDGPSNRESNTLFGDLAGGRTPPLSCPRPTDRTYQKRTKYWRICRHLPLLTLSNLFRVNSRWVDGDRVKVAL